MDKEKRWFRVKFGYGKMDFISIPEEKLAKCVYAWQTGGIFSDGAMLSGKEIKTITPDYHKHTGWNDWYEPKDAEDWLQIERDCPSYEGYVDAAITVAIKVIESKNTTLLDKPLIVKNETNILEARNRIHSDQE